MTAAEVAPSLPHFYLETAVMQGRPKLMQRDQLNTIICTLHELHA